MAIPKSPKVTVLDSGPESGFDRYTVVIQGGDWSQFGGQVFAMSELPDVPTGFNQYAGDLDDLHALREALHSDDGSQGRKLRWGEVPPDVKKAIQYRVEHAD